MFQAQLTNLPRICLGRLARILLSSRFELAVGAGEHMATGDVEHAVIQLQQFPSGNLNEWTLYKRNGMREAILTSHHALHQGWQVNR